MYFVHQNLNEQVRQQLCKVFQLAALALCVSLNLYQCKKLSRSGLPGGMGGHTRQYGENPCVETEVQRTRSRVLRGILNNLIMAMCTYDGLPLAPFPLCLMFAMRVRGTPVGYSQPVYAVQKGFSYSISWLKAAGSSSEDWSSTGVEVCLVCSWACAQDDTLELEQDQGIPYMCGTVHTVWAIVLPYVSQGMQQKSTCMWQTVLNK